MRKSPKLVAPQTSNGFGILRSVLERARAEAGCSLSDLTALSAQVDPYRLDTPAGHRDGQWLAAHLNKAIGASSIHRRGLHYVLVSGKRPVVKPDGEVYRNTDEDWLWLSGVAGKAARWLGYIPFERITDNRNAEPIIHRKARVTPEAFVSIGLDVSIPDADDIEPMAIASGFVRNTVRRDRLTLFDEIVETQVTHDHVNDAGVFIRPPPACGWRVLDAHREWFTSWQRRRPVVRIWKKQRK